jgi:hypothetical protein
MGEEGRGVMGWGCRCRIPRIVVPRCGDPTFIRQHFMPAKSEKELIAEQAALRSILFRIWLA